MFFSTGKKSRKNEKTTNTIVLANWKAHFAPERALQWCDDFIADYRPIDGVEVVVAVPFLYLREVAEKLSPLKGVELAAQTVSSFPQGNYSGATPASWLCGLVKYVILGHRERRKYFHETVQDVAKQVNECFLEELQPIVCIDKENATGQTAIFTTEELGRIFWAYTPADADKLERAHEEESIEQAVPGMFRKVGKQPILYGGGVNATNGRAILAHQNIAGILLGRGCLDGAVFAKFVTEQLV